MNIRCLYFIHVSYILFFSFSVYIHLEKVLMLCTSQHSITLTGKSNTMSLHLRCRSCTVGESEQWWWKFVKPTGVFGVWVRNNSCRGTIFSWPLRSVKTRGFPLANHFLLRELLLHLDFNRGGPSTPFLPCWVDNIWFCFAPPHHYTLNMLMIVLSSPISQL